MSDRIDPLTPSALCAVPEVRTTFERLDRAVDGLPIRYRTEYVEARDALLSAVRDAVLSAERTRLLGLTPEAVVEEAKMAAWEVGLGCNHGAECEGAGRCNECRLTLDAGFRAALPLLLAPEVAKREAVEKERDLSRKTCDTWYRNYMTVADAVARDSTGPEDLANKARATRTALDAAEARLAEVEKELASIEFQAESYKFRDKPHQLFSALANLVESRGEDRSAMDEMYERIAGMRIAEARLAEVTRDNERLKAALGKYGRHELTCGSRGLPGEVFACTCGFESALRGGRDE